MVDVDRQIDGVRRELHATQFDGSAAWLQKLTQRYAAPLETAWDALTRPERIEHWFLPVAGDLHTGGTFQLEGHAGGRVLECRPPEAGQGHYTVTWSFGGAPDSWVTVTVSDAGDGLTEVELEHVARAEDLPEGMWEQFGPGATGAGWDGALLGLALELGDQPEGIADFEAWQVGPEGLRFARGCADAWAAADAASGTDPATASARAEATFAFYTGQE